jgi:hypothetical protein
MISLRFMIDLPSRETTRRASEPRNRANRPQRPVVSAARFWRSYTGAYYVVTKRLSKTTGLEVGLSPTYHLQKASAGLRPCAELVPDPPVRLRV